MKKVLILIFLPSFFCLAQTKNYMHTPNQLKKVYDRLKGTDTNFTNTDDGFSDDQTYILNRAAQFYSDRVTNNVVDRGTYYGMMDPTNGIIPIARTYQPSPGKFADPLSSMNIHSAAIVASSYWANGDRSEKKYAHELATGIIKELILLANDDLLDFSNGKTKVNTTFGTTIRYDHTMTTEGSNPFFMIAAKMEKYVKNYGSIYDIVKDDAIYRDNKTQIEQWFKDAKNFFQTIASNSITPRCGASWRNNSTYTGSNGDGLNGAIYNVQTHAYFDSNTTGHYRVSGTQAAILNNRIWDYVSYVGAYGVYFDDSDAATFADSYFKLWLQEGVFPDGTMAEWYRSYQGKTRAGADYCYTTLMHVISAADLAQKKILLDGNGFSWYDYITSIGSDETRKKWLSESTSGGPKGIKKILLNMAKYHLSSSNGGYINVRYAEDGSPYNLTNLKFSMPIAIAQTYYRDAELEKYWTFDKNAGYGGPDGSDSANVLSGPHTMGIAWEMGNTNGGLLPYGYVDDAYDAQSL